MHTSLGQISNSKEETRCSVSSTVRAQMQDAPWT